ncbi:hypothetical protein [Nocardia tengchongensis]
MGHSWRAGAPPKSLPWLLVVLYAAFAGQQVGTHLGGGLLGSFLGGMVEEWLGPGENQRTTGSSEPGSASQSSQ